jgi:S1-C subfamily serine protease
MNVPVLQTLPQLSDAIVALVAAAAPMVAAIRVGPHRHVTGFVWRTDTVMTPDQVLPAQESYSLAMIGTPLVPARAARRDPATNLASLSLDTMAAAAPIRAATDAGVGVGALALVLGAAHDGSPTVRVTTVHRVNPGQGPGMLGRSVGGQNARRAYLGADRIGSTIELKLMREAALRSINLTIAPHPPD